MSKAVGKGSKPVAAAGLMPSKLPHIPTSKSKASINIVNTAIAPINHQLNVTPSKVIDELKFKTGNCNYLIEGDDNNNNNHVRQGFLVAEANSLNGVCILNADRDASEPVKTFPIGGSGDLMVYVKDNCIILSIDSSRTWLILASRADALEWGRFLTSSIFSNPLEIIKQPKSGLSSPTSSLIIDPPAIVSFKKNIGSIHPLSIGNQESSVDEAIEERKSISERIDRGTVNDSDNNYNNSNYNNSNNSNNGNNNSSNNSNSSNSSNNDTSPIVALENSQAIKPVRPSLAAKPSARGRPGQAAKPQMQVSKGSQNLASNDDKVDEDTLRLRQVKRQRNAQIKGSLGRSKLIEDALAKATEDAEADLAAIHSFQRKAMKDTRPLAEERRAHLNQQEAEVINKLKKTKEKLQLQLDFERQLRLSISDLESKEKEESESIRTSIERAQQLEKERLEKKILDDIERERRLIENEPVSMAEESMLMEAEDKIARKIAKKERKALKKEEQLKLEAELQLKREKEEEEQRRKEKLAALTTKLLYRKADLIKRCWRDFKVRTKQHNSYVAVIVKVQAMIRKFLARKLFLVKVDEAIERAMQNAKMVLVFQLTIFAVRYKRKKKLEAQNIEKILDLTLMKRKKLILKRTKQSIFKAKLAATNSHHYKREKFFSSFGQSMTLVAVNKETSQSL